MSGPTVKKYQCRRCGRMMPGPAVRWLAYHTYGSAGQWMWPHVPLCERCQARLVAAIEACLDGADEDDGGQG